MNRLKKKFMNTTLFLLIGTSMSFGMESSKRDDQQCPQAICGFKGRNSDTQEFVPQNFKAIEILRDIYQKHGKDALDEHHDIFIPFAMYLLEEMNNKSQIEHIDILKKEVNRMMEDKNLSSHFLLGIHFRYLALLEKPSQAEIELFEHTPSRPNFFKAFLKKDIYGYPVALNVYKLFSHINSANDTGNSFNTSLPYKTIKQINQELKKQLPLKILYPLLGEDILDLRFIINCMLNEIYPIGMPTKSVPKVHGENATPISFAYHDFFHQLIDQRRKVLKGYMYNEVSEAIKTGKWSSEVIPVLVPLAVQKYNLFQNALKGIAKNLQGDNHALAGLFFLMHEFPSFPKNLFECSSLSEIFENMLKGSIASFDEDESWHNAMDILRTNPVDGAVLSTNQEIKNAAIEKALKDPEFTKFIFYPYETYNKLDAKGNVTKQIMDEQKRQQARKNWLTKNSRIEVKKTQQFIDAILRFSDGQEITYTFPTLYRKWRNFDASAGILEFAGISLVQPLLTTDVLENRETALDFIEKVNNNITKTMRDFTDKAKEFFGEGPDSYSGQYALQFAAIKAKIPK